MILAPPLSTLFPYTTLFRSGHSRSICAFAHRGPVVASPSRDAFPSTLRWFQNGCSLSLQLPDFPPQILLGFPKFLLKPPKQDRKSTRLNSSHANISYAVFCL